MEPAGIAALVALAVTIGALAYLHLVPSGLSPIANPVSQYGISAYAPGYRVATIAFALAGVGLAVGIDRGVHGTHVRTVTVLLIVFALARAAISWFPMDAPGREHSATGRRHGLLALVAFAAVAASAIRLGTCLGEGSTWRGLAMTSSALGWAMVAVLAALGLSRTYPALRARFGLIERAFYLLALGWFSVFAVAAALQLR